MRNLLFGCDPEFAFAYQSQDGQFQVLSPAVLLRDGRIEQLGGDNKHPVLYDGPDFRFVMDGVAVELNLKSPQATAKSMYTTIQNAISYVEEQAHKLGLFLYKKPVINFDYKRWWTQENIEDEKFSQGIIFGCDADSDAFDIKWACKVLEVTTHPYRYLGGHWHISGCELFEKFPIPFVKICAATLGVFNILNSPYEDEEKARAVYYGKPGKYRVQKYPNGTTGVEYRTPSVSWCSFPEETFNQMFELAIKAVEIFEDREKGRQVISELSPIACESIINVDKKLAGQVLSQIGG